MKYLGITDENEEKIYLQGLTREPEDETLQMEYWQKLVNLTASTEALEAAMTAFQVSSLSSQEAASYNAQAKSTHKAESTRTVTFLRTTERNLKLFKHSECKLEIVNCWVPEDADWQRVGRLVANRKYQRALDHLEGLIMNRAGTGYKLRKHITKALQTRSVAIRSALNTYNAIAAGNVMEYAFLADFDLLRDMPCGQYLNTARSAMDLYFKMCRAREEIQRLNALAHQIAIHRNVRGRFNLRHLKRIYEISKLTGFSGTIGPGVSTYTSLGDSASAPKRQLPLNDEPCAGHLDTQEDLDEEEQDVLRVADDFSHLELHRNVEGG
ncbi:hypothetical protein DFH29DRAFT_925671, partial [Suillus ampliporus]